MRNTSNSHENRLKKHEIFNNSHYIENAESINNL